MLNKYENSVFLTPLQVTINVNTFSAGMGNEAPVTGQLYAQIEFIFCLIKSLTFSG